MALQIHDAQRRIVNRMTLIQQPGRDKGGETPEADELRLPGLDHRGADDVAITDWATGKDVLAQRSLVVGCHAHQSAMRTECRQGPRR